MEIKKYKTDKTLNQIKSMNMKGLLVLEKLYIDLAIEEIYKKNNLEKGLEDLNFLKLINNEELKRNTNAR